MNIGIIESEHFETAYPLIRLFDIPGNRIVVFTNEDIYPIFRQMFRDDMHKYTWVIRKRGESLPSYLVRVRTVCVAEHLQLLYCNTISNNHLLYAALLATLPRVRKILTVHDINCLFASKSGGGFKNIVTHYGKRSLIRAVDEFNVISDTMVPHLAVNTGKETPIHHVPGAVFGAFDNAMQIQGDIRIVVAGTIDRKRRRYEDVFRLLQLAEHSTLPLQLELLGGASDRYGHEIIKQAKEYRGDCTKLVFHESAVVAHDVFEQQLNNAHFIWIPSVIETKICGDIPEVYGETKSSGNIFDVIRHGKPFLAPARLKVPERLAKARTSYNELEEIIALMQGLLQRPGDYKRMAEEARTCAAWYSVENIRNAHPSLFTQSS